MHSSLRRMEYNRGDYLWAGNTPIFYAQTFPAISSASLRTSFFLYVFAFPSNVSLAPRTSSKPWSDNSHAGDRYTDRASVASNRYANYQQTSEAIEEGLTNILICFPVNRFDDGTNQLNLPIMFTALIGTFALFLRDPMSPSG